ncbi:hypothetical protein EEB14_45635 [Rhodococcus sp. WS4]|nr:hypothetical protein EEB14_45635 [Rhodococcus sp. WS4]
MADFESGQGGDGPARDIVVDVLVQEQAGEPAVQLWPCRCARVESSGWLMKSSTSGKAIDGFAAQLKGYGVYVLHLPV